MRNQMIILDGAAGADKEAQDAIKLAHQILVVTNPDYQQLRRNKTVRLAQRLEVPVRGAVSQEQVRNARRYKNVATILEHPVLELFGRCI